MIGANSRSPTLPKNPERIYEPLDSVAVSQTGDLALGNTRMQVEQMISAHPQRSPAKSVAMNAKSMQPSTTTAASVRRLAVSAAKPARGPRGGMMHQGISRA
jgi:hypothetical protein